MKERLRILKILLIALILALPSGQAEPLKQEPVPVKQIDLKTLVQRPVVPVKRKVSRSKPEIERRVMIVTAYTKSDRGMDGKGITASGEMVQEGQAIAADRSIPFGTEIYIPALNHTYITTDRGGAIKGNRLDLYMERREDALRFGVRELEVWIKK